MYTLKINSFHSPFENATENLEYTHTFACNVIERNGNHFVNITNADIEVKFGDFSMKFTCGTSIPLVIKLINHAANANRRLIFAENEENVKEILNEAGQAFIKPIFDKFAIQELLQKDCE